MAGCGELHVEICLNDLELYAGCAIVKTDPVVSYRETIVEKSSVNCLAKSANGHNRLFGEAVPLEVGLSEDIDNRLVSCKDEPKARSKYLHEKFGWDRNDAGVKLWSFGPENTGPNVIVDMTKGI